MKFYRIRRFESLGQRHLLTGISLVAQPAILDSATVLAARDMDADGDQDIIVSKDAALAWLENQSVNGVVKFEEHPLSDTTSQLIELADLDGDEDLDLIVHEPGEGIAILENAEDGFVPRRTIENPQDLLLPWWVRAADMDADGDQDLVVSTPGFLGGGGELSWYANDGSGSFDPLRVVVSEGSFNAISIADLDGDNDLDFVVATASDTPLSFLGWIENMDGGSKFEVNLSFISFDGRTANEIQLFDPDNDGDLDIVTANRNGIGTHENTGGLGTFAMSKSIYGAGPTWSVAVADMDGDGEEDVVATRNHVEGGVSVLTRNGSDYVATTSQTDSAIRGMVLADIDLDGHVDVLPLGEVGWLRNQLAGDFDMDGVVGFEDFLIFSANFGESDAEMSEGDLDADGMVSFADFVIFLVNFGSVRS